MSSHIVLPNIPSGLYSALDKAVAKFPLKDVPSETIVKRLDRIVPSFRSEESADSDAAPTKTVDYEKIKALLRGPYSANLYDRHVAIMEKLAIVLQHEIVSFLLFDRIR